jgi:hypothetical protein
VVKGGEVKDDPRLDELRAQIRERVQSGSLHAVARAVEMSPRSLEKLMNGAPVLNARRNQLSRWLRETERVAEERGEACSQSVLVLVADLPDGRKMPAIRAMLGALRAEFKPGVAGVPLWLDRFLAASGNSQPGRHGGHE